MDVELLTRLHGLLTLAVRFMAMLNLVVAMAITGA
jgi:hypothetical protein